MGYFIEKRKGLMTQRQYEAALNRLSSVRKLLNKINYNSNMGYAKSKIWHALKRGETICYLEYPNATEEEVKDIVARLEYLGYNVEVHISYAIPRPLEIKVRLDNNEEGINYVPY